MYLNFARQSLPIERWSDKNFRKFGWSPPLDFDKNVLLDDIGHFLLLLFSFVDLLLEFSDLLADGVETMAIR
jgi:hypothetical protein